MTYLSANTIEEWLVSQLGGVVTRDKETESVSDSGVFTSLGRGSEGRAGTPLAIPDLAQHSSPKSTAIHIFFSIVCLNSMTE